MTEQPRQLGASMDDLLRLIGQLTVENQLLRAEVDRLSRPQNDLEAKALIRDEVNHRA